MNLVDAGFRRDSARGAFVVAGDEHRPQPGLAQRRSGAGGLGF